LGGERVDMVKYDEDVEKYIANSLSPAKVLKVELNNNEKRALVKVVSDQLSLAIGKRGQNVRLAARLTGWKIDIMDENDGTSVKLVDEEIAADVEDEEGQSLADKLAVEEVKEKKPRKPRVKKEKPEVVE
jgi:N utilization substance protein A